MSKLKMSKLKMSKLKMSKLKMIEVLEACENDDPIVPYPVTKEIDLSCIV